MSSKKTDQPVPLLVDQWAGSHRPEATTSKSPCVCFDLDRPDGALRLHAEEQNTTIDPWKRLLDLVEEAAADARETFAPAEALGWSAWDQIVTLPHTIAKLERVKHLMLYGSRLVRLPPEIGQMSALEELSPYTSYRLHWFPYEITRCAKLVRSTVSTRALYGNHKWHMPLPDLDSAHNTAALLLARPERCSVCAGPFHGEPVVRWIDRAVATDRLPLLVFACSRPCVAASEVVESDVAMPNVATPNSGTAVIVPLEKRADGMHLGKLTTPGAPPDAEFFLECRGPNEATLREELPRRLQIASWTRFGYIHNTDNAGAKCDVDNRRFPVEAGVVYLRVDTGCDFWNDVVSSRTVAIYQPVDPGNVAIRLIAVVAAGASTD